MGLFNFNAPSNDDGANDIELIINDERITVNASEAEGLTIAQVFARFASRVADTSRVNRYVAQGRIVAADSQVEPGTIYSAAIASETKGADSSLAAVREALDLLQDCAFLASDEADQYLSEWLSETGYTVEELNNA